MKTDFMKLYESLSTLNEAHVDPADYWNEPWELEKISDYVYRQWDIDKADYVSRAWAEYNARKQRAASARNIKAVDNNTSYSATTEADDSAAKEFWADAKNWNINLEAFHKAYDAELEKLGALGLFNSKGELIGKYCYGKIKSLDANNSAVKAAKKLWALSYTEPDWPKVKHDVEWITPHIYQIEHEVPDMADWTDGYVVANSAEEAVRMAEASAGCSRSSFWDYDVSDYGEALPGDKEKIEKFMQTKFDRWYSRGTTVLPAVLGRNVKGSDYYEYCKTNKILSLDGLIKE